jgi:hypothetical protein
LQKARAPLVLHLISAHEIEHLLQVSGALTVGVEQVLAATFAVAAGELLVDAEGQRGRIPPLGEAEVGAGLHAKVAVLGGVHRLRLRVEKELGAH